MIFKRAELFRPPARGLDVLGLALPLPATRCSGTSGLRGGSCGAWRRSRVLRSDVCRLSHDNAPDLGGQSHAWCWLRRPCASRRSACRASGTTRCSLWSLVRRGFTEMLAHLTDDAHPPLYYVLAWLWINVAGSGERLGSCHPCLRCSAWPRFRRVPHPAPPRIASRRDDAGGAGHVQPVHGLVLAGARGYVLLLAGSVSFFSLHVLSEPRARWLAGWAIFSVLSVPRITTLFRSSLWKQPGCWCPSGRPRGTRRRCRDRRCRDRAASACTRPDRPWSRGLARAAEAAASPSGDARLVSRRPLPWPPPATDPPDHAPLGVRGAACRWRDLVAADALVATGTCSAGLPRESGRVPRCRVIPRARRTGLRSRAISDRCLAPARSRCCGPFAIPSAARLGIAVTAVTCGLWLAVFMVTATSPRFQRDDWRLAAETLGEPRGTRAIVVMGSAGHFRTRCALLPGAPTPRPDRPG